MRMQELFKAVKKIADVKCANDLKAVGYMTQTRILNQAYEMVVENVPASNLLYNRSYMDS
jgi:hypothetical protein